MTASTPRSTCGDINRKSDSTECQFAGSIAEHYSPESASFQLGTRLCAQPKFFTRLKLLLARPDYFALTTVVKWPPMGAGNPSAILGRAAIVRNKAIVATASVSFFMVELLCERVRTEIECRRRGGFSNLIFVRF
jgi:hypothetical protein